MYINDGCIKKSEENSIEYGEYILHHILECYYKKQLLGLVQSRRDKKIKFPRAMKLCPKMSTGI